MFAFFPIPEPVRFGVFAIVERVSAVLSYPVIFSGLVPGIRRNIGMGRHSTYWLGASVEMATIFVEGFSMQKIGGFHKLPALILLLGPEIDQLAVGSPIPDLAINADSELSTDAGIVLALFATIAGDRRAIRTSADRNAKSAGAQVPDILGSLPGIH